MKYRERRQNTKTWQRVGSRNRKYRSKNKWDVKGGSGQELKREGEKFVRGKEWVEKGKQMKKRERGKKNKYLAKRRF